MSDAWLVVGLGNPGPDYQRTRHNVGVDVLDELGSRAGVTRSRHRKAAASVGERRIVGGPKVVLAFPETYMNRSGGPVASLMDYYGVPIEQVVVIHDELDLPFGAVRLKRGGGAGGHNGLRDVIAARGADFIRVRVGIGRPPGRQDPADFVLKRFASVEQAELPFMIDTAADAVEHVLRDGLLPAQQALHAP
ncbi:aminoacyl-tRNA hydrolase [Agrococcus versicolor]|uniref:Peptidyl-tRNA hydrolase n=1 Tax=Agrococcus versicolor TaxID=501482 RepID=A0ABN3AM40_9MICO